MSTRRRPGLVLSLRPVLIGFLWSLIGPVWFFEVLGLWWTSLGLGLSPWRSKTETGLDFQSLRAHSQLLGCAMLLAVLDVTYTWPIMGICVELVMMTVMRCDRVDTSNGEIINH